MCPACIATVALVAAGATSTGGLTALVVKTLRPKTAVKRTEPTTPPRGAEAAPSYDHPDWEAEVRA